MIRKLMVVDDDPDESDGSGIGLAIVKKIMLNHSGFVFAVSELGKGATFRLYFPKEIKTNSKGE